VPLEAVEILVTTLPFLKTLTDALLIGWLSLLLVTTPHNIPVWRLRVIEVLRSTIPIKEINDFIILVFKFDFCSFYIVDTNSDGFP